MISEPNRVRLLDPHDLRITHRISFSGQPCNGVTSHSVPIAFLMNTSSVLVRLGGFKVYGPVADAVVWQPGMTPSFLNHLRYKRASQMVDSTFGHIASSFVIRVSKTNPKGCTACAEHALRGAAANGPARMWVV
jgi:hypothetical protein